MRHLTCKVVLVVVATVMAVMMAASQTPPAKEPAFEVASIKPSKPGTTGGGIRPLPGGQTYIASNVSVRLMIKLMYKITDTQIVGAPSWIDTERWDVEAKATHPATLDQLHEMFQNLLADRFKLRFHRESREMRAYVLSVDKGGSKLKLSQAQEPFDIPIKPTGPGKMIGTRVPMSYLCWVLSQFLDTPVVDMTGLEQFYDFMLEWTPPPPPGTGGPQRGEPSTEGPSIFTALREDLGLKLESGKAAAEVFVIDHVDRPSEN